MRAVAWIGLAALVGFLPPAVFSTGLRWERSLFLFPYVLAVWTFLRAYFRRWPLSWADFVGDWRYGLAGVVVATAVLVGNVWGQPPSAVPRGASLVVALAWVGVAYGAADGLLLNVMPVLAVQRSLRARTVAARLARGGLALGASLAVTAAYHLGYEEFRGPAMLPVLVGNAIMSSTYLLTGSPLAAVVSHIAMHVAAVLHGMETTLQLPPHYGP
jgi:hypothetical protein